MMVEKYEAPKHVGESPGHTRQTHRWADASVINWRLHGLGTRNRKEEKKHVTLALMNEKHSVVHRPTLGERVNVVKDKKGTKGGQTKQSR